MTSSTELQYLDSLLEEEHTNAGQVTQQYLTFSLGEEHYGIEIQCVQEIRSWESVTLIPNTPDYICGLLNLRSAIIPVVDLRLRFEMAKKDYNPTTVVIILKVNNEQRSTQRTVGLVVDAVSDTDNINLGEMKPSPDFGEHVDTTYIRGLVSISGQMDMILDVDLLLSVEALA